MTSPWISDGGAPRERRRVPLRRMAFRALRTAVAVGAAATLTLALAQDPARSAFTGATGSPGNSVTASADFCPAGGTTVTASEDTTGYQKNPTTVYGGYADLGAASKSTENGRALLRFPLPSLPAHCVLATATLRLYANTVAGGRTIQVFRVDPAGTWSEAATTWNTLPAVVASSAVETASLSSAGWQQWMVTGTVTSHYAGTNSGFLVRDKTEDLSSTGAWQLYDSRDKPNKPELVLTWD